MRRYVLLVPAVVFTAFCFAQLKDPVRWSFSTKKMDATTYEIHLAVNVDYGWHIYSQNTPGGGPIPTTVSFIKNPLLTLQGELKEVGKVEKHFEDLFGVEVIQFSNKIDFVQKVKVKANVKTTVNGSVEYMTCNDHECLPPTSQKFSIVLQ